MIGVGGFLARIRVLIGIGAGSLALVLLTVVLGRWRTPDHSAPPVPPAAAPAVPVFHEELAGRRYSNQDLRLSVTAPEGWSGALGDRSQDRSPYEGLVVRMTPAGA